MTRTDLDVRPDYLTRVQALYPGAVGIGKISGSRHQVKTETDKMVKRGEIIAVDRFAKLDNRTGVLSIPYVRMKTPQRVRRERAVRLAVVLAAGLVLATGAGWLLWEVRTAAVAAGVALSMIPGGVYFSRHWRRGCPGLHCQGCGGR